MGNTFDVFVGRKISDIDKESLEEPITLGELDIALKGINSDLAPGPDGISVKFLQKFCRFLRHCLKI